MKGIIIHIAFSLFTISLGAQVSISLNNTPPDSSAMLDIQSTSGGLLIPRLDSVQRQAISNPAEGLMVYDLDTKSFWYFKDSLWTDLNAINRPLENGGTVIRPKDSYVSHDMVIGSPQLNSDGIMKHNSRMFFHEKKRAFRVGSPRDTSDFNSNFVFGDETDWNQDSLGYYSFAAGLGTKVTGNYGSAAMGQFNEVTGDGGSMAFGKYSEANGNDGSIAIGNSAEATGNTGAIALGYGTEASGAGGTIAAGMFSTVSGSNGSISLGRSAEVSGNSGSIAAGYFAETTGDFGSIALGHRVTTNGSNGAATMGTRAIAQAEGSMVIGGGFYDDFDNENIFMTNNIANSLMVGFRSNIPTFYVGPSPGFTGHTGKVGIGTTNPQGILHVNKTAFSTGTQVLQVLEAGSGNPTLLFSRGGGGTLATGMSIEYERTGPDVFHKLYFNGFNANTLMTLHSNGKLGIGTTDPAELLDVAGNIRSTGSFIQVIDGNQAFSLVPNAASGYVKLDVGGTGHAGDHIILGEDAGGTANNVGIGTNSPDTRLHISGTDNNGTTATLKVTSGSQSILMDGNEIDAISSDLLFQHNTSHDVILASGGGRVGIGTTTPDVDFEIEESSGVNARLTSNDGSDVILDFKRSGDDWRLRNDTGILLFGQSTNNLSSVTDVLRLGGGSVTPATDNTITLGQSSRRWTAVWAVDGSINTSDARLKKNIKSLDSGLDKVLQLNPVRFQWKDNDRENDKDRLGFLAQELQKVLPEVVVDHEWQEIPDTGEREWVPTEHLGVKYHELIPILVIAIQELSDENDQLQQKIENIENFKKDIDQLKDQLSQLIKASPEGLANRIKQEK